jgi:hypothetical protein
MDTVGREAAHHHDVSRTVADRLVGDVQAVVTLGVQRLRNQGHVKSVCPFHSPAESVRADDHHRTLARENGTYRTRPRAGVGLMFAAPRAVRL